MNTISITYDLVWEVVFATNYKITKCKKMVNCKTCKEVKKVMNGGSIGYCLNGKFYSLTFLRKNLVKISRNNCPF